jgi:hypothetical protein
MAFKKYDEAFGTNFLINISPIDLSLSTWSINEVLLKGDSSLLKFFLENGQQRKRRLIAIYYDLNFLLKDLIEIGYINFSASSKEPTTLRTILVNSSNLKLQRDLTNLKLPGIKFLSITDNGSAGTYLQQQTGFDDKKRIVF